MKKNNLGEVVVNFNAEVGSVLGSSVPRQPFNSSCHGDHYIIVEHVGWCYAATHCFWRCVDVVPVDYHPALCFARGNPRRPQPALKKSFWTSSVLNVLTSTRLYQALPSSLSSHPPLPFRWCVVSEAEMQSFSNSFSLASSSCFMLVSALFGALPRPQCHLRSVTYAVTQCHWSVTYVSLKCHWSDLLRQSRMSWWCRRGGPRLSDTVLRCAEKNLSNLHSHVIFLYL